MPEKITVSKSADKDARQINFDYELGENLDAAVDLFGEEAVFNAAKKQIVVDLQSFVRRRLKSEDPVYSDEDILAAVAEWKPGVRTTRGKSKEEKMLDSIKKMDPEDRKAFLATLQSALKG